ncbi:MAG TPA: C25 family cysteine peptidase, partial [Vicinamibacteria bacterium]|nr:C25 family cysteine peptidase [Vicinamibacteria bacterium]
PFKLEAELANGVLFEGENQLQIENVGDTQAANSLVLLDRFALTHPRRLAAVAGELEGRFGQSGSAEVQGAGPAAFVVDTTSTPERWLTGAVSTASGVSFRAEAGRRYLAVAAGAVRRPQVRPASPSALRDRSNRADYLVLGPREFLAAAQPLLDHRRGQGLEALGVAVEEVYDEFGHGEPRPEAVRAFLGHAYHNWERGPRYVLLLGDATYDFKDRQGTGVVNRVPPYMIADPYMWTVSDPAYASVNGEDLLPDLAIGRLPAQSLEQAERLVQKTLAWEQAGFDLSGPAVLVADNSDHAGDFEGDAERVAGTLLAGREVERVYLSRLGGATRATIQAAFDRGASLMSYLGHGAIALWASENIFIVGDVASLAPQAQQPVLLTMNCLNGYFHFPFMGSLAEQLVEAEGKGAIAAFAPSSMSVHAPASVYHEALVAELASGGHTRLGDAILAAQARYADAGQQTDLLAIYQLLGDPALKIR